MSALIYFVPLSIVVLVIKGLFLDGQGAPYWPSTSSFALFLSLQLYKETDVRGLMLTADGGPSTNYKNLAENLPFYTDT